MNFIFLLAISISLATSSPVDKYRVNEGASTSSAPQSGELTDAERCELDKYAESIVFMALADDVQGGELRDMIDNRYYELEAYVEFVESFYNYAKYGAGYYEEESARLLPNFHDRLKYMHLKVYTRLTEILYSACSQHYHTEVAYVYNRHDRSFTTLENIHVNSNRCLCSNANERGSCGYQGARRKILGTLHLRAGRDRPVKFLNVDRRARTNRRIILSQHHIVPLSLIAKFFKVWMNSGNATSPAHNLRTNGCVRILNTRLKRSLQKVTVHKIRKMNEAAKGEYTVNYDIYDVVEHDFFNEFFQSLLAHSAGGNIFVGPSDRGPLDPSFGTLGDDAMTAFEVDCEPIIGRQRWREMFSLYQRLLQYVEEAPRATAFDRMRSGIELFVAMMMAFSKYDLATFNENQWEQRRLSPREMSLLSERLRQLYRDKKFWSIKNSFTRPSRFVVKPVEKCYSMETFSKQRWNDFFMDIMELLMEGYSLDELPSWSCILNRLHFKYKFFSSNQQKDECSDLNFESYLYRIISKNPSWHQCINFDGSYQPEEWCSAWRRIMLNSDVGKGHFHTNGARPEHFYQDVKTVIGWLLKQVAKDDNNELVNCESSVLSKPCVNRKTSFEKSVCYHSNSSSLTCPNYCGGLDFKSKEMKTSVYTIENDIYNQEWFTDTNGKLKCQCPPILVEILSPKPSKPLIIADSCDTPHCEDLR